MPFLASAETIGLLNQVAQNIKEIPLKIAGKTIIKLKFRSNILLLDVKENKGNAEHNKLLVIIE